jgi:8-oxo-dGTP pyrophosphatase MutT (NUDIX family)
MLPEHFLTDQSPLQCGDAVAAIISVEDGRYLMQLRDDIPHIFYPGHWGCFGGAVGDGEAPRTALKRELHEELEWEFDVGREFVNFDFDLTHLGLRKYYRTYYEVKIRETDVSRLSLHEGAEMQLLAPERLFGLPLVPYDSFATWLHVSRQRLSPAAAKRSDLASPFVS